METTGGSEEACRGWGAPRGVTLLFFTRSHPFMLTFEASRVGACGFQLLTEGKQELPCCCDPEIGFGTVNCFHGQTVLFETVKIPSG